MTILLVVLNAFPLGLFAGVEDLSSRVKEIKLSNGLTALLVERHLSPTVSFHIFFPVGSLEDEPGKTGLAHLFEHMMFKGTKTVGIKDFAAEEKILDRIDAVMQDLDAESAKGPSADLERLKSLRQTLEQLNKDHEALIVPEEYWTIYERAGAQGMNASTANDITVYMVELPANKIELWMAMESDHLAHPVVREFYKERAVVMEERRLRVDTSPSGKLWEVFMKTAFGSHPYAEPVVGTMEDLTHLTRRDAIEFYRRHYKLSRAVVTIVGDFSTPSVERELQKYFGPLKDETGGGKPPALSGRRPGGPPTVPSPHFSDRPLFVKILYDAEPEVMFGYPRPALGHPDGAALAVLTDVLQLGRTSRLYQSLIEKKHLALNVEVWNSEPGERHPDLFVFDAVPRAPHTPEECVKAIEEEIEKLKKESPSPWELQKVKNNIEAEFLRGLSSNAGLGWRLGYYQALLGDWRYLLNFLEQLRQVKAEDVSRVARAYLDPQRKITAVRVKKTKESKEHSLSPSGERSPTRQSRFGDGAVRVRGAIF